MSRLSSLKESNGSKTEQRLSPITLAILYADMEPSPGQTRWIKAICSKEDQYRQIVAKTARKGGKTKCMAVSYAWLYQQDPTLKITHLAGSYLQASRLYDYFRPLVTNPELFPPGTLVGEPTRFWTKFTAGGFLEVLTASSKAIRGGDSDILSGDEVVCIPQKLIDAMWPLIRASHNPYRKKVLATTASPEVSLEWFLRLWQQSDPKNNKLGFERFEWSPDECPWLDQEEDATAKLMLDSQTYAVEYGGEIAARTGRVWGTYKLPDGTVVDLIDHALVDPRKAEEYPLPATDPLTEKWSSLDWGFVGQSVLLFWEKQGDTLILRDCRIWTETSYTEIKQEIVEDYGKYPIYPDSEAVSDNADLTKMGMRVIPVIFSKDKAPLISHARWRLENKLIKIPNPEVDSRFFTLVQQLKAYHYKNGKPEKVNDHGCDALICGMKPIYPGTRAEFGKLGSWQL